MEFKDICHRCRGLGGMRCPVCKGTGQISVKGEPGKARVCHNCGGTGQIWCMSCDNNYPDSPKNATGSNKNSIGGEEK